MKIIYYIILPLFAFFSANKLLAIEIKDTNNVCVEFNGVNTKVRDGEISKEDARQKILELIPKINTYFINNGGKEYTSDDWVFPLKGYGSNAIGGKNGSGYNAKGYDYYDGNKHGGHPAQDIFIHDRDLNCLDDNTDDPVDVLSMSSGVVVALEKSWNESSDLRGGKYIWIYDTYSDGLFYYAHNRNVVVNVGDIVKPGDKIAEVGRSGLNAYKKRSPTHLHITYLEINNGKLNPVNLYDDLLNVKIVK
jgi:peptidoglycan LD-endopeptidase LytH